MMQTDHRTFVREAEGDETWQVSEHHIVLRQGDTLTIPPFTSYRRMDVPKEVPDEARRHDQAGTD